MSPRLDVPLEGVTLLVGEALLLDETYEARRAGRRESHVELTVSDRV